MELSATPVTGPVVFSLRTTSRKGVKNVTLSTSSKSVVKYDKNSFNLDPQNETRLEEQIK